MHLRGNQILAIAVEQVRDALQKHAGLSRSGDAVDQQHVDVVVTDDLVLLTLNGCGDGLQLLRVTLGKLRKQQRVLDGNRRVEARAQLVVVDVELTANLQIGMNHAIIDAVRRGADLLVIVGLGNGASPVDDEMAAVVIGHARRSQVDVARGGASFELQLHFREVRARNKLFDLLVAVHAHFHGAVVALDDAVHRLVLRQGFHSHVVGREVKRKLVTHVAHVLRGLTTDFNDAICGFRFNIKKLGVGFAKVRLLLLEGLVRDVLIGVHRSPLRCAKMAELKIRPNTLPHRQARLRRIRESAKRLRKPAHESAAKARGEPPYLERKTHCGRTQALE